MRRRRIETCSENNMDYWASNYGSIQGIYATIYLLAQINTLMWYTFEYVAIFLYNLYVYNSQEYIREGIDTTKSVIKFRPQRADNGKTITCKAENPKMRSSSIEDSILLSISCEYLNWEQPYCCLLYTSDAADDMQV